MQIRYRSCPKDRRDMRDTVNLRDAFRHAGRYELPGDSHRALHTSRHYDDRPWTVLQVGAGTLEDASPQAEEKEDEHHGQTDSQGAEDQSQLVLHKVAFCQ